VRALVVKGQSILLRTWTLRPDNAVEPVHHQNRTKRGSRANCHSAHDGSTCRHWSLSSFLQRLFTPLEYQPPVISTGTGVVATWYLGENHPTLWLDWLFCFPVDALTLYKFTKLHLFIVFMFQFRGVWSIVWGGLAHQIPPVATGLVLCETWKSIAVPRSIWLPNNCRKAFAHFGQVYLMCLIFVKNLPILGKVD